MMCDRSYTYYHSLLKVDSCTSYTLAGCIVSYFTCLPELTNCSNNIHAHLHRFTMDQSKVAIVSCTNFVCVWSDNIVPCV